MKRVQLSLLLLLCTKALSSVAGDSLCEQNLKKRTEEFQTYQLEALRALKQISNGDYMCSPCPNLEKKWKREMAQSKESFERRTKDLIAGK